MIVLQTTQSMFKHSFCVMDFNSFRIHTIFNSSKADTPVIICIAKIVSEYDQELPQSQTADSPLSCKSEHLNTHYFNNKS